MYLLRKIIPLFGFFINWTFCVLNFINLKILNFDIFFFSKFFEKIKIEIDPIKIKNIDNRNPKVPKIKPLKTTINIIGKGVKKYIKLNRVSSSINLK